VREKRRSEKITVPNEKANTAHFCDSRGALGCGDAAVVFFRPRDTKEGCAMVRERERERERERVADVKIFLIQDSARTQ